MLIEFEETDLAAEALGHGSELTEEDGLGDDFSLDQIFEAEGGGLDGDDADIDGWLRIGLDLGAVMLWHGCWLLEIELLGTGFKFDECEVITAADGGDGGGAGFGDLRKVEGGRITGPAELPPRHFDEGEAQGLGELVEVLFGGGHVA